jgi:hypothetical protein
MPDFELPIISFLLGPNIILISDFSSIFVLFHQGIVQHFTVIQTKGKMFAVRILLRRANVFLSRCVSNSDE